MIWAIEQGATAIDIQPVFQWTDENKGELWLSELHIGYLKYVISELLDDE